MKQNQKATYLKSLKTITVFCLLPHHIHNRLHQFCTLRVMPLCPVVTCPVLSENKVVRSEYLSVWSGRHGVHGAGFKVH